MSVQAPGVPKDWSYRKKGFQMFKPEGIGDVENEKSLAFPFLQADVDKAFLERGKTEGHNAVIKSFLDWVKANKD
jgi:hypothetical protein